MTSLLNYISKVKSRNVDAGDGVKHKSRYGSEWAARRYRTLLHVVANWIASGNVADNLNDLHGRRSLLGVRTGNRLRP